jgi:hypothetical protein
MGGCTDATGFGPLGVMSKVLRASALLLSYPALRTLDTFRSTVFLFSTSFLCFVLHCV